MKNLLHEPRVAGVIVSAHDDTDRTVWDRSGAPSDSVSAPVLTWNLPIESDGALSPISATATSLGLVAHFSQMALRAYPVRVPAGNDRVGGHQEGSEP